MGSWGARNMGAAHTHTVVEEEEASMPGEQKGRDVVAATSQGARHLRGDQGPPSPRPARAGGKRDSP